MKYYLGADPGMRGALAFYHPGEISISSPNLHVFDMPLRDKGSFKKYFKALDGKKIKELFNEFSPILAYVEEPNAMPKDGVASAFGFGKSCGYLEGILSTIDIPVIFAVPGVWKLQMGLNSNKEKSLIKARELFPGFEHYFKQKKDDGRAEAAILAWLAHKKFNILK